MNKAGADNPIGVFDSGIGGLTVARALMDALPNERIIYFGDTARVPYGVKSTATICHYATQITEFLLEKRVKMLIVACNTMAAVAIQGIRELSPVPVLDVLSAGARHAAEMTASRSVAVIGTPATIGSDAYTRAIHAHDAGIRVTAKACPLFVPLVEEGWFDHPVTCLTAEEYLGPLLAGDADTMILGCTHYPLLRPVLQKVVGHRMQLIDSATTVAGQARQLLEESKLATNRTMPPEHEFHVTDVPLRFRTVGERFLGRSLESVHVVKW